MIQSFFLISNSGEILIEKHWRELTPRSICDFFWDEVTKCSSKNEVPPIITTSKYYLINVYRNDIFLLATTTRETSPLLVIEFLHRVYDILFEYFDSVEEATIRDNFSTVYQLLEEMMDYGYPLTTEPNALKAMIAPPTVMTRLTNAAGMGGSTVSDILPNGTISNMPWRKTGVKYLQNEIYLDIIEEVDAIIDKHGVIISTEVNGIIQGNSRLSGVPDLTLTFVDPELIDDCSFHPCVRYNRFERDKVVSFVPPDGNFELMKYRVHTIGPALPPCSCSPQFSFENNHGTVTITLGAKSPSSLKLVNKGGSIVMEDVTVLIPFSKYIRTANLNASTGTVIFDEATKVATWTVGKLSSDKYPQLTGSLLLQQYNTNNSPSFASTVQGNSNNNTSSQSSNSKVSSSFYNESNVAPVIEIQWKVPMASVSGLAVSSLQLTNERYKPYKGVRTVAKSGKFLIRSI